MIWQRRHIVAMGRWLSQPLIRQPPAAGKSNTKRICDPTPFPPSALGHAGSIRTPYSPDTPPPRNWIEILPLKHCRQIIHHHHVFTRPLAKPDRSLMFLRSHPSPSLPRHSSSIYGVCLSYNPRFCQEHEDNTKFGRKVEIRAKTLRPRDLGHPELPTHFTVV